MSAPDRTVRHLRLRARDEAEVRSAARQLEDALRCASLPDTGGRLLLVRRLDLGRVPADISSQTLALLVERRVQECGYTWVHGATPVATQANAVWFHDAAEALITLARHVVERRPQVSAWFWRSVLPGYSAALAPLQILEMIVTQLATQSIGRVALPELVAALARIVAPEVLPTHFTPAAQRALHLIARQLGMRAPAVHANARTDGTSSWHSPQGDVVRLSSSVQALAPWLPILLAAARWTETTYVPAVIPERPDRGDDSGSGHEALDSQPPMPATPDSPDFDERAANADTFATSSAPAPNLSPELLDDTPTTRRSDLAPTAKPAVDRAQQSTPCLGEMYASRAAGLLFLLPLLARLGFDAWSAALTPPQAQSVAVGVLRQALRRLGVSPDDPAHAMLAAWPEASVVCGSIEIPLLWRDPRIALQMPAEADSVALAALWLTACRRSLRRAARIGLASLVLRSGAFAWSLTHLDAHFDLLDTDLRVRRNGLDIDPGWLPWLGRVVSFHYQPGLNT